MILQCSSLYCRAHTEIHSEGLGQLSGFLLNLSNRHVKLTITTFDCYFLGIYCVLGTHDISGGRTKSPVLWNVHTYIPGWVSAAERPFPIRSLLKHVSPWCPCNLQPVFLLLQWTIPSLAYCNGPLNLEVSQMTIVNYLLVCQIQNHMSNRLPNTF